MAEAEESVQVFRLLVRYLLRTAKYIEKSQIEQSTSQELSEWRDEYMSVADVLKKEGFKEGQAELLWKFILRKFPKIDRGYHEKLLNVDKETIDMITFELFDMEDPKELDKYL